MIKIAAAAAAVFMAAVFVSLIFSDDWKITSIIFKLNESRRRDHHHVHGLAEITDDDEVIRLPPGVVGPESFGFDVHGGGPYTGVSDGRIIRWLANESRWVDFAVTSPHRTCCGGSGDGHYKVEHICGRPLGLQFYQKTGHLYIADAYMGLLQVGPSGGLASQLATQLDGLDFRFVNSLDIDQNNGLVYFTQSSSRFTRRNHISIMMSGDNSGRLMRFDPITKNTTLLLKHLMFPNGVALSKSGDFLLFVETTTCKLYKLWLKGEKVGVLQEIAQLPGFPDNIRRKWNGEFWVGIHSRRSRFMKWLVSNSWIGNVLLELPLDLTRLHLWLARLSRRPGMAIRLSEEGDVIEDEVLDGTRKGLKFVSDVSEVNEQHGDLWIGSVNRAFAIKAKVLE